MAILMKNGNPITVPDEEVDAILAMFPRTITKPSKVAVYNSMASENKDDLEKLPIQTLKGYAKTLGLKGTFGQKKTEVIADILKMKSDLDKSKVETV